MALVLLSPVLLILAVWVAADSKGGSLYRQWRVGKNGKPFRIWKFRTMYRYADSIRSITVGSNDNRITKAGLILRKYKMDELPQLYNVLTGTMSLVGPRPELKKYVDQYSDKQLKILSVRPGITDIASLVFSNENHLLATVQQPEIFYTNTLLPLKLRLNKIYVQSHSTGHYFTFLYWSILHLLHIPCTRIQQVESSCMNWIQSSSDPIIFSSRTLANLPA